MSCAKTWHLWKCDGCGKTQRLEHGDYAEPRIPTRWWQTLGWGLHACSAKCRDAVQARQVAENGKRFIWLDWREPQSVVTSAPLSQPTKEHEARNE